MHQDLERRAGQQSKQVSRRMLSDTVTEEHVADIISRSTGIPLGSLLQGEVSTGAVLASISASSSRDEACLFFQHNKTVGTAVAHGRYFATKCGRARPSHQSHFQLRPSLSSRPSCPRTSFGSFSLPRAHWRGEDPFDEKSDGVPLSR